MLIYTAAAALGGATGGAVEGVVIAYLMPMPQKGRVVKWLAAERALAAAIQRIFCENNPFKMSLFPREMLGCVVGHIASFKLIQHITDNSFPEFDKVVQIAFILNLVSQIVMFSPYERLRRENNLD